MKRDIESEVIEWLEWHIGAVSGGMGMPTSYDCSNPRGSKGKRHIPTPPDFPKRLRVCNLAMRALPNELIDTLQAKYLLIDFPDIVRADKLGVSKSQYYRRLKKAMQWLEIGFEIAEGIERNRKLEMA